MLRMTVMQRTRLLLALDVCQWELTNAAAVHATAGATVDIPVLTAPTVGDEGEEMDLRVCIQPKPAAWLALERVLQAPNTSQSNAADSCTQQGLGNSSLNPDGQSLGVSGPDDGASDERADRVHGWGFPAEGLMDWAGLGRVLDQGKWARCGAAKVVCGGKQGLLPCQYSTSDRLLCQVGSMRWGTSVESFLDSDVDILLVVQPMGCLDNIVTPFPIAVIRDKAQTNDRHVGGVLLDRLPALRRRQPDWR